MKVSGLFFITSRVSQTFDILNYNSVNVTGFQRFRKKKKFWQKLNSFARAIKFYPLWNARVPFWIRHAFLKCFVNVYLCRSKRRGFHHYVQGQVKEISKNFADEIKKLEITLKKQEVKFWTICLYFFYNLITLKDVCFLEFLYCFLQAINVQLKTKQKKEQTWYLILYLIPLI